MFHLVTAEMLSETRGSLKRKHVQVIDRLHTVKLGAEVK